MKASTTGQQPGTKSGHRPADKPLVNHSSLRSCLRRGVQDGCLRCLGVETKGGALDAKPRPSSLRPRPDQPGSRQTLSRLWVWSGVGFNSDLIHLWTWKCPGRLALIIFPGHAGHEKDLHRQKGVVPLASGQERRAAIAPQINSTSTNRRPRVVFHDPVYVGFNIFVCPQKCPGRSFSVLGVEYERS